MANREQRLSDFNTGIPPAMLPLELLCEDHSGTYTCHRVPLGKRRLGWAAQQAH